jgi:hypothetical protein
MRLKTSVVSVTVWLAFVTTALAATGMERIRNDKAVVTEETLSPGEREAAVDRQPSVVVYMSSGAVDVAKAGGAARKQRVKAGQTEFQPAGMGALKNVGTAELHLVRVDFLTAGSDDKWGMAGLSPHYVILLENRYARAYDIKIPAQTFEPKHTHHDRVVVCLSGAELEHILPDGTIQPSTLKTGEVGWRAGATHTGHNLGHTELWVIAVEPK